MSVVMVVLVSAGLFIMAVSALGLLRFPDFYSRVHAVSTSETMGVMLVFLGLLFHPDVNVPSGIRLVLVLGFALVANSTAAHALARAARRGGITPWTRPGGDT